MCKRTDQTFFLIIIFLVFIKDLSAPIRDWTHVPYGGSVNFYPLDLQGGSCSLVFYRATLLPKEVQHWETFDIVQSKISALHYSFI